MLADPRKKSKKVKGASQSVPLASGKFPYHPEEEFIDKKATLTHTFPFTKAPKRDEDAFGVEQHGRIILADTNQLVSAIQDMEEACR